jgi:hypothetical protein
MLNRDAMRQLRGAYSSHPVRSESEVLEQLGNPSQDEIVNCALAGLASDDRNVRVLMLRVLSRQSGPKGMRGILTGLSDPKRRVREVAIRSSPNYHAYPEITDRLGAMVTDERETRRIRGIALRTLVLGAGPRVSTLPAGAAQALGSLAESEAHRTGILIGLLHLDLTEHVERLLREFVENGTKEEAVMATRALCGYRVLNLGQLETNPAVRKYVIETCDIAAGRVIYWVKRDEYDALVAGRLPSVAS